MKTNYLFKIENLVCSYNGTDEVLKVDYLEIPLGKIVVLLGASGSGKSTILETLGLMNRTIKNGSKVIFKPKDEEYDLSSMWNSDMFDEMALVRQNHFSFIFQSTNLMPNFTAFENISITQMLAGLSKNEAINEAIKMADSLGLSIDADKKAFEMSGGEKQRAAFIRAITPEFSVLFGDEPTGNLDRRNASKLLSILRKTIHDKGKTAIIVSHDLELALSFADMIIVLEKPSNGSLIKTAKITPDTIFNSSTKNGKKNWYSSDNEIITNSINSIIERIIQ